MFLLAVRTLIQLKPARLLIAAGLAIASTFCPLLGLGVFAISLGLGLWSALFSLGMMLAYSVVMGTVYGIVYSGQNKWQSGTESRTGHSVPRRQISKIITGFDGNDGDASMTALARF